MVRLIVVMITILCGLATSNELVAQSCSHANGPPWYDNGGEYWYLEQSASGVITGVVNPNQEECAAAWPVSGTFTGNGDFVVTAINPLFDWCAQSVQASGHVLVVSCDEASVTLTNNYGAQFYRSWGKWVEVPSTEVSQASGDWGAWYIPYSDTAHWFNGTLFPGPGQGPNYGGRFVTEWNYAPASDQCDIPGDSFDPIIGLPDGTGYVLDDTNVYTDLVGWASNYVTYYRAQGRAPCSAFVYQEMRIDCSFFGDCAFKQNVLMHYIGTTQVSAGRDNAVASRVWP